MKKTLIMLALALTLHRVPVSKQIIALTGFVAHITEVYGKAADGGVSVRYGVIELHYIRLHYRAYIKRALQPHLTVSHRELFLAVAHAYPDLLSYHVPAHKLMAAVQHHLPQHDPRLLKAIVPGQYLGKGHRVAFGAVVFDILHQAAFAAPGVVNK